MDEQPNQGREPVQDGLVTISQIKAAVIRDLENLLNTKRQILPAPAIYRELNKSLFVYGLEDYTATNPKSISVKQRLRQDIEQTILRFEPRLKNVAVQFETLKDKERNLQFRISALLVIEPVTEPVTFDTFFDLSRGEYRILR